MGFSVPLAEWFRTTLKPVFQERAFRSDMERYIALPEVRRLWTEHQSGLHDRSRKLWNLLMLASWDGERGARKGLVEREYVRL